MDARLQDRINRYELAVAFAREFVDELGEERAFPIIQRAFEKLQQRNGRNLAQQLGSNSFDALAEHNRQMARDLDGFEVLDITDREIKTRITRCVAYEAFEALGMPELCRLYCESDHPYIRAYNPNMKLIRTKEIANGDAYCDHVWALEE
jgi:predicted ArsR family transcriptional regulator